MNTIPIGSPALQVDESAKSAMLDIELVFARHAAIPRHMRLAILSTLLATEIVEAALESDQSLKATATLLAGVSTTILTRQVDAALQTQGAVN